MGPGNPARPNVTRVPTATFRAAGTVVDGAPIQILGDQSSAFSSPVGIVGKAFSFLVIPDSGRFTEWPKFELKTHGNRDFI